MGDDATIVEGKSVSQISSGDEGSTFGFFLSRPTMIDLASRIERAVCGNGYDALKLQAAFAKRDLVSTTKQGVPYISGPAIAQYRLSDYYYLSEGDLWQSVILPIELSGTDLLFRGEDNGANNEIKDLFSPDMLDMHQHLLDMLLSLEMYGVVYPFEAWDNSTPIHLSILNPRYIAIGTLEGFGQRPLWLSSAYGFDEHLDKLPDEIKNALGGGQRANNSMMYPLNPENCQQVRDWCAPWLAYPPTPLVHIFRVLSLRQTLEELKKATIEGYKSQLWAFLLGDNDHPSSPAERKALNAALSGQVGDRTGFLIWDGKLRIEQHVPKPLDSLMGNDQWRELTQQIMRGRGISLRLLDGEVRQQGADTAPSPLDIKVFLERLKRRRARVEKWVNGFVRRYAQKNNMAKPPAVSFEEISIYIEERIKSVLNPLFSLGAISHQTLLEESQISTYEIELRRKKEEEPNAMYFGPKPTFSQVTVNPKTPEKTAEHTTPGRPPNDATKINAVLDELDSAC